MKPANSVIEKLSTSLTMTPSNAAERILNLFWRTGKNPSLFLPVDSVQIAQKLGIKVFEVDLDHGVSSALLGSADRDPVLLLRARDSVSRKRINAAHQLGHFVHRANEGRISEEYEFIEFDNTFSEEALESDEIFASEFAAALLMPEKEFRDHARRNPDPVALMQVFRVSAEAAVNRLQTFNLNSVSASTARGK